MRAYFSDGKIWYERIAGLPKSLVAYKADREAGVLSV
jgi:hypothetical protein